MHHIFFSLSLSLSLVRVWICAQGPFAILGGGDGAGQKRKVYLTIRDHPQRGRKESEKKSTKNRVNKRSALSVLPCLSERPTAEAVGRHCSKRIFYGSVTAMDAFVLS